MCRGYMHMNASTQRSEVSDSSRAGVTGCACWKLNSGPQEEHYVLLTTEPSPKLSTIVILWHNRSLEFQSSDLITVTYPLTNAHHPCFLTIQASGKHYSILPLGVQCFKITIFFWVCVVYVCIQWSEGNFRSQFSPSTIWVPGITEVTKLGDRYFPLYICLLVGLIVYYSYDASQQIVIILDILLSAGFSVPLPFWSWLMASETSSLNVDITQIESTLSKGSHEKGWLKAVN